MTANPPSEPVTSIAELVGTLRQRVRDHYVFAEVADEIAARLDAIDPASLVEARESGDAALAELLTATLQSVNGDLHLRVRHRPAGTIDDHDEEAWAARYAAEASAHAGGVRSVRRVGDTGVLDLAPYLSPAPLARPYIEAAFGLLTGVRHLVVDVRDCVGADPDTVTLLCGHLLGDQPVHLQDLVSRTEETRSAWTMPAAPGLRLPEDVPVHVLVSGRTFSGGEELAYDLQALGRAIVVGEVTGGGAHPREAFVLTPTLEAHVPVARSVNAVTGTNWEHVGVRPDLPCPADLALEHALGAATRATVSG